MEQHNTKQDDAGDLRPLIQALRARKPTDQECDQSRERLRQRLEAERLATPLKRASVRAASRLRRIGWPVLGWSAVAIAVVAMAIGLVGRPRPGARPERPDEPVAWGEAVQGDCSRIAPAGEEHRLSSEDPLYAGDRVRVGPDSSLRLRTADGSKLLLWPGAEAVWLGRRSNAAPAIRLVRGEMRADIARVPDEVFSIDTPAAALRVLGTEFDVRVLNGVEQEHEHEEAEMSTVPIALARTFVVLTVLSGAVAVDAAGQEKIVKEGERAVVAAGAAPSRTEKIENIDYVRNWLRKRFKKPDSAQPSELLMGVTVRTEVLQSLVAMNPQSRQWRPVTDFVGSEIESLQPVGGNIAIVAVASPIYDYSLKHPVGGVENPLSGSTAFLVDLASGEKLRLSPLQRYRVCNLALSPDWRQLAFAGYLWGTDERSHHLLNLETLKITPLPQLDWETAWSPDSRWLACSRWVEKLKAREIVLVDTLTGELRETGLRGMHAQFSPDGKQLAYVQGLTYGKDPDAWNVFLVKLPKGKPTQLTHLTNTVPNFPTFSPDGSRLLYWESSKESSSRYWDFYGKKTLHDVDLGSGADRTIGTLYFAYWGSFPPVQWLDANSRAVVRVPEEPPKSALEETGKYPRGYPPVFKEIDLAASEPSIRDLSPPWVPEAQGAARSAADRLAQAFAAYDAGARAEFLHVFDEAEAKFARARDLLADLMPELKQNTQASRKPLRLQPEELDGYCGLMGRLAAVGKAERSFQTIYQTLESVLPQALAEYYCGFNILPPEKRGEKDPVKEAALIIRGKPTHRLDLEACAREAAGKRWGGCPGKLQVLGEDIPLARRVFVVPGDDPDKVVTSFQVVRPDRGDGVLVIRTPVLANGKRLEATYRVKEVHASRRLAGWEFANIETKIVEVK